MKATDDDIHAIQPKNGEYLHKYLHNEFYFLTDPDEFIFKLRADDDEKQLLKQPVTLDQFVDMPFTWSPFLSPRPQVRRTNGGRVGHRQQGQREGEDTLALCRDHPIRSQVALR